MDFGQTLTWMMKPLREQQISTGIDQGELTAGSWLYLFIQHDDHQLPSYSADFRTGATVTVWPDRKPSEDYSTLGNNHCNPTGSRDEGGKKSEAKLIEMEDETATHPSRYTHFNGYI